MLKDNIMTQSEIKKIFEYNKESGALTWKADRVISKRGQAVGYIDTGGYGCVKIDKKKICNT